MYNMEHTDLMKSILDEYIERLNREDVTCLIPARKGLRKLMPRHIFHDYPEIFLQTRGCTIFSFPGEELILSPGEILIVPPELPHGEIVQSDNGAFENLVITPASGYVQCHLSRESGEGIPSILHYETYESEENVSIRQLSDLLVEKGRYAGSYGLSLLRGLSLTLLTATRILLEGSEPVQEVNPRIRDVKNAVLSRFHDSSLKVSVLAEQMNCTADYLSWLFHRETGMTLNRYINELRLNRAADLLKNTDYSISEIAWICGYRSPAYFSRLFSRGYGTAPGKFRKIH